MRLRQIALVAQDLEAVAADLTAVLGLGEPYRDPGVAEFGLHNVVYPIGDTYLEVVSPKRDGTTAGRQLERRNGDGGYMVIFQTDDLARAREHVGTLGIRVVWEVELPDAATLHLHPRDVGAAIVSIDAMTPATSWRWAGPGWEKRSRTDVVTRIAGVELQTPDPAGLAERWSKLLERPAEWDGEATYSIALPDGGGEIRIGPDIDGRGEGVSGVWLETADTAAARRAATARGLEMKDDTVTLCGTRFRLVSS
jgi:hypothetical protein